MKKCWYFFLFSLCFFREFLFASLSIAAVILFCKKRKIQGGLARYCVSDLTSGEQLAIAHLITLTPGTISTEIDLERHEILVHCLGRGSKEDALQRIDQKIKQPLLRFTRC